MKINIRTKGDIKVSDSVREYISNQLSNLKKMFNENNNVNVNILCVEKDRKYTCEITINLKQIILRSECNGDTLYAAINLACDKIEQQFIKHKRKVNAYIKKREGISEYFAEDPSDVDEEQDVVRIKKINMTEMSVDEAITQMELTNHDFFLFTNEETHKPEVVYKRDTGGYGVIETLD